MYNLATFINKAKEMAGISPIPMFDEEIKLDLFSFFPGIFKYYEILEASPLAKNKVYTKYLDSIEIRLAKLNKILPKFCQNLSISKIKLHIPRENWVAISAITIEIMNDLVSVQILLEHEEKRNILQKLDKALVNEKCLIFISRAKKAIQENEKVFVIEGLSGKAQGAIVIISSYASVIFGRKTECSFSDTSLAKKHCFFYVENGYLKVRALDEKNKLYVDNALVTKTKIILPYSKVRAGLCAFTIKTVHNPLHNDFNSIGQCHFCGEMQTQLDVEEVKIVRKKGYVYCLECLAKGEGDFKSIGGYKIISKIGCGGMSKGVYLAVQPGLDRFVALKLMKNSLNASEKEYQAFCREVRIAGKMKHKNLAYTHDVGYAKEGCYVVMELIMGDVLSSIIKNKKKISSEKIIQMAIDICEALFYMHKRNIIHRDLKPSNIFITYGGITKLSDFGLAKNLEESGLTTRQDVIKGTIPYISPEQIQAPDKIDQRSDIYSLGVALYELCTGTCPIVADDIYQYALKLEMTEKIKPIKNFKGAHIIHRCLEKDRRKRFQTVDQLINAFKAL